jgi:hypothetical protein
MADIQKVKLIGDVDMVGDERRTWYVVEWKNEQGKGEFMVDAEHTPIIANLECPESDMVRYCILSPVGADISEIRDYIASGNSRLTF